MVRIAVCDDEKVDLEYLAEKIEHGCSCDCEIVKYEDGENLLADSRKQVFDVLFLDIDMPGMDGMQVAETIREENQYVKIVFVTNKEECVFQGYRYGAFRFMRKSCFEHELPETMASLEKFFDSVNELIVFKKPGGEFSKKISEIRYIEVQGHNVTVNCGDTTEQVMGTMREYEKKLSAKGFIRIHKGFLVNFRNIYSIEQKDIVLDDSKKLPLSRNRINETKTKLQVFTRSMDI